MRVEDCIELNREEGLQCRYEAMRDCARDLQRKLAIARTAISIIAHGKQSMRDYANDMLARTAPGESANAPRQGCEAYPERGCSTIGG
jgi:hypothetical protein